MVEAQPLQRSRLEIFNEHIRPLEERVEDAPAVRVLER